MQKIEYKESPSPHVVIENFMPIPAARACLKEAQWLQPVYEPAMIGGTPKDSDGCEECEALTESIQLSTRKNEVVYVDEYYKDRRFKSDILSQLTTALMSEVFIDTFKTLPHMFPIVAQTTHMQSVLSSYGMCDFYGWHTDVVPEKMQERIITCVVHWNTEPQKFTGGELVLTGETIKDQLAYKPVHNTAIFFQSNQCVHGVNETQHEGTFEDNRFSINLWLGFESPDSFKYR